MNCLTRFDIAAGKALFRDFKRRRRPVGSIAVARIDSLITIAAAIITVVLTGVDAVGPVIDAIVAPVDPCIVPVGGCGTAGENCSERRDGGKEDGFHIDRLVEFEVRVRMME